MVLNSFRAYQQSHYSLALGSFQFHIFGSLLKRKSDD
jgi:hypothetical protein